MENKIDFMQCINPLLVKEGTLTPQEEREMKKNKKNLSIVAKTSVHEYLLGIGKEDDKKLFVFLSLLIEAYPENDILLQKLIVPFSYRVYGNNSVDSISKTTDDLEQLCRDYPNLVTPRVFNSQGGATHISLVIHASLDRESIRLLGDREVMLPLINSKGRPRTSNIKGGYLTCDVPVMLKAKNQHDFQTNVKFLNHLQEKVVLTIDEDYWEVVKDPSTNSYERTATIKSVNEVLSTKSEEGKAELRYVWASDSRLRVYPHAWGLNPNGREWLKGLFDLPFETLTEEGKYELITYVGAMAGYSKSNWTVRILKANDIIDKLGDISKLDKKERLIKIRDFVFNDENQHLFNAEDIEPYLLIKALAAYYTGVVLGEPVGLIMRQDATSSGLQIMGALDNEVKTMTLTNLIDTENRYDAYRAGYNEMSPLFKEGTVVTAKGCKSAIMTHFYCSEKQPLVLLGEDNAKIFKKEVGKIYPAGQKVMDEILSCWSDREFFKWTLPNGNVATYKPTARMEGTIGWTMPNGEEVKTMFTWFIDGKSGRHHHLPANIIQSFDAYILEETIMDNDFTILPNHDEYGSHPNNASKVRKSYHKVMTDICSKNYLNSILKELNPMYKGFKKSNTGKISKEPGYGLC